MTESECQCSHRVSAHMVLGELGTGPCRATACNCQYPRLSSAPAPELSETEAAIVARFEAAPAAPESYAPPVCPSYSHGEDGWRCAVEGPHDEHRNAAGDVAW